jgi:stage IV sporulation protein FB
MKNAWKLFDYGNTPVYLKYWYLGLFFFLPIPWVIMVFVSILVHELAHVNKANKLGYKTDYVFIDIFHGGALIDSRYTENDKHSIAIAFSGPASNFMLSLISFLLVTIGAGFGLSYDSMTYVLEFTAINFLMFAANLVPIYPLDGGRISKAFFSMVFGKERGKRINGGLSLVLSSLVLIWSIMIFSIPLMIFSVIFMISSFVEMKPEKNESIN